MAIDRPVKDFLDRLASDEAAPWRVLAVAGTASAVLAGTGVREALGDGGDAAARLASEVETLRGQLEAKIGVEPTPAVSGSSGLTREPDYAPLLEMAEQAVAVLEIASRTMAEARATTRSTRGLLVTAIALGRAAVEGTVQVMLASLPAVSDDMARTALRTRAQGIQQKARRVEVEFLQAMLTGGQAG